MRLEDITPETLDAVAEQWDEERIGDLVRESVSKLGDRLLETQNELDALKAVAKIRAIRLHHHHGFTPKEIGELLQLPTRTISSWVKP